MPGWRFPPRLFAAAWIVLAVSYTVSGVLKLRSPEWVQGRAFAMFLANTLHRDGFVWGFLHALPSPVLAVVNWFALGTETLCGPLALWRRTRPVAWVALAGMHLLVLTTMRTTMLSLGALLPLAFTFDARWLDALPLLRRHLDRALPPAETMAFKEKPKVRKGR